jgi:hypothetical protein
MGVYMKRVLFGIIAALIIFMISSYANSSDSSNPNYFSYTTSGSTATITGLSSAWTNAGKPRNITIPASINGYSVTSIGTNAFAKYTELTSITIPSSVTSIGENAFGNCFGLSTVHKNAATPPTTGTTIFSGCKALTITVPSADTGNYSSWTASYLGCTSVTIK